MTQITPLLDLRPMLGPVRDQGRRPTCLAFAASDAHASARGAWEELSADYLYLRAQLRSGVSTGKGSSLDAVLGVLREHGQPTEADLPYATSPPPDLGTWAPPPDVRLFRRAGLASRNGIDLVHADLELGIPSVMLLMLSRSFFLPDSLGVVDDMQGDPPDRERRHAVVAVGHGQLGGQRLTLVRNSWGSGWADGGHAWLTDKFVQPRLYATAKMMEDLSVSAYPHAA